MESQGLTCNNLWKSQEPEPWRVTSKYIRKIQTPVQGPVPVPGQIEEETAMPDRRISDYEVFITTVKRVLGGYADQITPELEVALREQFNERITYSEEEAAEMYAKFEAEKDGIFTWILQGTTTVHELLRQALLN